MMAAAERVNVALGDGFASDSPGLKNVIDFTVTSASL